MIKKSITYEDLNGNQQTVEAHFHLNKAEIAELEVSETEGLSAMIERITKEEDNKEILAIFKRIILTAYGMKSEDGQRFIKDEARTREFSQTEAYAELFMELAGDADAAAAFVNGIIPNLPQKPKFD